MGILRFIVLLMVAGAVSALAALAVRAGLPEPAGAIALLVVLAAAVALVMRTPQWGSSVRRSREQYSSAERF